MRLSEFFQLDTGDQIKSILHDGVLVSKKRTEASFAFLFQLEGYYVETIWNVEDKRLMEIRTSTETSSIDEHLQGIEIGHLLH